MNNRIVALVLAGLMVSGQVVAKPSKRAVRARAHRTHKLEKRIAKHASVLANKKLKPAQAKKVDKHLVKMVVRLSAREARAQANQAKRTASQAKRSGKASARPAKSTKHHARVKQAHVRVAKAKHVKSRR